MPKPKRVIELSQMQLSEFFKVLNGPHEGAQILAEMMQTFSEQTAWASKKAWDRAFELAGVDGESESIQFNWINGTIEVYEKSEGIDL